MNALARVWRRWRDAMYARRWGLPRDAFDERTQRRVAAVLRADAILGCPVEMREFVEAHDFEVTS